MTLSTSERAWAIEKSRLVAEATATNLHAAETLPYALGPRVGERSGTFVCVGAGPSLSTTGPELARESFSASVSNASTRLMPERSKASNSWVNRTRGKRARRRLGSRSAPVRRTASTV